ncbi:MAG: carboxypeptidase regulatory-like domain-containing protein [Marinibacterium sp.]|nr:carboxypeptidase regulatory-like domain-containing protein [Marinibacterium sp.]
MTYYYCPRPAVREFEFTAFAESDLGAAGAGHNVNCGDTFTMPVSATVCMTVTDNDRYLSGDNYWNENTNDRSYQTATITDAQSGDELGNGGQVYAEQYFWVKDGMGNYYILIEIEQEGTNDDYFAFYTGGGYDTPAPGTELTIVSQCNVRCDWVKLSELDAGPKEPPVGALSGRYFCDDDGDGLDNDGAGNGIAGVEVLLLDANGNETGLSTLTDADGNYSFTDLAPGTYGVKFVDAVSGKVLTATNVDNDQSDDIDSDATDLGGGMSIITGITVTAGETNTDNDAGVVDPNTAPAAHDDAGEGCADEDIVVNVLANDSDPDGDTLQVTSINGVAIADGETVQIDGVNVTLNGGSFVFDGETAFAGLTVGEMQEVTYSYQISDGNGGVAMAEIDVTFCGVAETLEEICDSLPATVSYQIINEYGNGNSDAFTIRVDGSGDARLDGIVVEAAYCVSAFDPALGGTDFTDAPVFAANLYCAIPSELPADLLAGQMGINGQSAEDNLDLVNWILNQDFTSNGYTDAEVQAAIWGLTDSIDFIPSEFGDLEDVREIVDLAVNNGEGFEAGQGDIVGLIIDPNPATDENSQPFILGVAFDSLDCIC